MKAEALPLKGELVSSIKHFITVCVLVFALFGTTRAQTQGPTVPEESKRDGEAHRVEPSPKGQVAPPVQPSGERKPNEWRKFFANTARDQKDIWTSPFHLNGETAKWWALFGGATAALIATDRWTSTQLPNTRDQIAVSRWTSRLGSSYVIIPATATFWIFGRATDSPRARETGRLGVEALADAFLVNNAIKTATQRERPLEGDGKGHFWAGSGRLWNAGASFPSGHATYSWTLASVIAHEFPHPRIIPITAYALATTVCASRLTVRKHFASDIVVGGAIGWFIGHYVYGKRHNPDLGKPGARDWLREHVTIGGTGVMQPSLSTYPPGQAGF